MSKLLDLSFSLYPLLEKRELKLYMFNNEKAKGTVDDQNNQIVNRRSTAINPSSMTKMKLEEIKSGVIVPENHISRQSSVKTLEGGELQL